MRATQNVPAINFPRTLSKPDLLAKFRSTTHIGPPLGLSASSIFLCIIDSDTSLNLMAIPKKPTTHIQNTAPGPPSEIAKATPPIFPSPTVADNAVESA